MHGRRWLMVGLGGVVAAWQAQAEDAGAIRPLPAVRRPRQAAPLRPVGPTAAESGQVRPPPAIDRPALQPVGPGEQAAPVPFANAQPPLADRQPHPSIAFGVLTPQQFGQGDSFTRPDSLNESARAQQGLRLPSPGVTFRLPVW
jgi:hypothetical protein